LEGGLRCLESLETCYGLLKSAWYMKVGLLMV